MTIIPEFLLKFLTAYWALIETWLSEQYYARMVHRAPRHCLVRLASKLDLQPIEQRCGGYHHTSGPGAKPSQPVARLVRALLVKYLYNLSLREAEERMNNDLMVKWFVGYGLFATAMDHTSLERFEQWVEREQPRLYFDSVLTQIEGEFPAERTAEQIGDTFAMRANAAREGLLGLLRHTGRILLEELAQQAPAHWVALRQQWSAEALFGDGQEPNPFYLNAADKQARLVRTVRAALALVDALEGQLAHIDPVVQVRLALRIGDLRKIIADDLLVQRDAQGLLSDVSPLGAGDRGTYQIASATDREATIRHHGKDSTLGYNTGLAITPAGFIREIQSATGAEPDQTSAPHLIEQQHIHLQLCPPKLIYDQAAGAGRTRAEVLRVSQGQTQLVAHVPPSAYAGRFSPYDFSLDDSGLRLTCPGQKTTDTMQYDVEHRGRSFSFSVTRHCRDCPCWAQCRSPKAKADAVRTVYISYDHELVRQALAYAQTAQFRADMRLRPIVERVIFMLTNYDGARRARRRGKHWADFQGKMCAMARNLRTWLLKLEQ